MAAIDVIVQADLIFTLGDGVGGDVVGAAADGENLVEHPQCLAQTFDIGVGPQVTVAVPLHPAGQQHLGKRLLGDHDKGVGLVVPEQDIVARLVMPHQVLFTDQGLDLIGHHDPIQVGDLGQHAPGLEILASGSLKIGAHPVAQHLGLADVDGLALGVLEQVYPRLPGQALELVLEGQGFWHSSTKIPAVERGCRKAMR